MSAKRNAGISFFVLAFLFSIQYNIQVRKCQVYQMETARMPEAFLIINMLMKEDISNFYRWVRVNDKDKKRNKGLWKQ